MVKKKVFILGAVLLCTSLMLAAGKPGFKVQDSATNTIKARPAASAVQGKLQAANHRALSEQEFKRMEAAVDRVEKGTRDCADATITINILTDGYGYETSWEVVEHGTSTIVAAGPATDYEDDTLYTEEVCVDSTGCYDFTIYDAYGDGIFSPGYYEVSYNGTLVGSNYAFSASSETVEYIGGGCVLPTGACCLGGPDYPCIGTYTEAECDAAASGCASWVEGEDCATYTCLASELICPSTSMFCQPPHAGDDSNLSGIVSDVAGTSGTPLLIADDYSVAEDICGMVVWGVRNEYASGSWPQCVEDPMEFEIIFYEDDGGLPGAAVCTYSQSATAVEAGTGWFGTDTLWRWTFDFAGDGCCTQHAGWVSVQGTGDPELCLFLWISSPTGANNYATYSSTSGTWGAGNGHNLSMCLLGAGTGACCDDSTGNCTPDVDEDTCLNTLNGTRFTPGLPCEALNPPCGVLMGACCDYVTGACTMKAPGDCVAPDLYQGDYTNCETSVCGGACCIDSTCIITTEGYCTAQTGVWYGLGSDCDPSPCTGACCHADATCTEETTAAECVGADDVWLGGGTTCAECPCIVICPAGATAEPEACGEALNEGCNEEPYQFTTITCGETICGTAWADGTSRDTDWYEVVVTTPTIFTFSGEAENFEMVIGVVSDSNDVPVADCALVYALSPYAVGGPCEPISVSTGCLEPGTYWFFAGASSYNDVWPCPAEYVVTLTCETCILEGACCASNGDCTEVLEADCAGYFHGAGTLCAEVSCTGACCYSDGSCTDVAEDACMGDFKGVGTDCLTTTCPVLQPGDACSLPLAISLPADLPFASTDTTCGRQNSYEDSTDTATCLTYYTSGEDIFYEITVTTADFYNITMTPDTTWSGIALSDTCPPGLTCLAYARDSGSTMRDLGCVYLDVGTYYLMIDTYATPDCINSFDLAIDTCVPPSGRCCYLDAGAPMCVENIEIACAALAGQWTEGLNCTDDPCPVGRCCYNDPVECADVTELECDALSGVWSEGLNCTDNPCPALEGNSCEDPIVVTLGLADLPYVSSNTTCDRGNNFEDTTDTATCLGYYTNGEDIFYEFTITEAMDVTITLDPHGTTYSAIALTDTCPPGLTCIAVAKDSASTPRVLGAYPNCISLAAGTYYIMIDTWSTPYCIPTFDLTIAECVEPTGACCVEGVCQATNHESECDGLSGEWFEGEDCATFECPQACPESTLRIEIQTDSYPSETSWEVYDQNAATVIASGAPTIASGLNVWDNICVEADGCYDFTIYDSYGDGIFSPGYYEVYLDDVLVGSNYDFDSSSDTVDDIGGGCIEPTGACCVEGDCVATNTEAECDGLDGDWFEGEDCATFEDCPQPCPESTLRIEVRTDGYASETDWELYSQYDEMIIATGDPDTNNTLFVWEICVETNGCYDFTIYDSYGDGIFSPGYYEVYFDDVLVGSNYDFDSSEETVSNIGGCISICGDFAGSGGTGPDGFVDQYDYWFFLDSFATCVGDLKYHEECDLSDDDCINWLDYMAWVQCYRDANPGSTWAPPVPKKIKKLQPVQPAEPDRVDFPSTTTPGGVSLGVAR